MKTKFIFTILTIISVSVISYGAKKNPVQQPQAFTFNLALVSLPQADKYANLDYGIRLNVQDVRANQRILQIYDASPINIPSATANPSISSFVPESVRRYIRIMGFNLDADVATDYLMQLDIKEFHVDYLYGVGWNGTVIMDMKVYDHNHTLVYPTVEISGRATIDGNATSGMAANIALNNAYVNALADADWDKIAFFLHKPKTENNKDVEEEKVRKTPLFWSIDSRPQGADIFWRISSATDDVKNQNPKYLGTTLYEATEALNIKGLTYENASQVEIVIKCEKDGYAPQTKKVSVSSALDEKEILMFFRLVRLEEE